MNPFYILKEPEVVNKILGVHNLAELHSEIKGDGYAFCPIEGRHNWGLVVCHKDKQGMVTNKVVTCLKIAGEKLWAETMSEIMMFFSEKQGCPLFAKVQDEREVVQRN